MTSFVASSYLGGHDFSSHSTVLLDPPSYRVYDYIYGDLIWSIFCYQAMDAVIRGFCYISTSFVIHGEDKEEAGMDESEEK